MVKIYDISASRAKRSRGPRGLAVAAMLAAAVTIVGAASLVLSFGEYSPLPLGHASASARMRTLTDAARADPASSGAEQDRGFDYFPDHYRNQATEPAEPIATF